MRRVVDRDHAGARAGLDRHVADRHAAFHRQRADRWAGELDRVAGAAGGADPADDGQHDVLGGDAARQARRRPSTSMFFIFFATRRLRGQHVLDLGGADAEAPGSANAPWVLVCESPQTTVMPGSVAPCSGPITWTMPWRRSLMSKYGDAELARVGVERLDLQPRDRIGDAAATRVGGRHVVVGRGHDWRRRATACARPAAGPRRPAGWSLRAPGGGRCRAAPCRRPRRGRRGASQSLS